MANKNLNLKADGKSITQW